MSQILDRDYLANQPVPMVLDGGFATTLVAKGGTLDHDLWASAALLTTPAIVEEVHRDFAEAGADIITTCTYQASVQHLKALGLAESELDQYFFYSVEIARQAVQRVNRQVLVAASCGPYGATLLDGSEYRGGYQADRDKVIDFHRHRIELTVAAGPDLIAFETIPSFQEARDIVGIMHAFPSMPYWLSFSTLRPGLGAEGDSFAALLLDWEEEPALIATGVNCCAPSLVTDALAALRRPGVSAHVVYPHLGQVWDEKTRTWNGRFSETPLHDTDVQTWMSLGARIVGGCCGVRPDQIAIVRDIVGASS